MTEIFIRRACVEDSESVYKLVNELEDSRLDISIFINKFEKNIQLPQITYLVAIDDTKIVGFVSLQIVNPLHHRGKVAIIQELVVSPEYRSKGIGGKLFNEVEKISRRDCEILELTSSVKRELAHKFYTSKMGMHITSYKFVKDL